MWDAANGARLRLVNLGWNGPLRLFSWSVLRTMRVRAGLTQQELAAAIGASRATIASLERGRSLPSLSTARALAQRLDVAVEDLFPDDDRQR